MRRDIGILAARMRLRTESAIRTLARKQRNEITKKLNQDLYRSFVSLDFDNSGSIDIDELRALVDILQLDYTEENLQKALNLADADGNGTLDFEEFRHIISVFAHRGARKRIIIARREAFSRVCTRLVDIDHARSLCASLVKGVTLDDVKKNGSMGSHIDFDGEIPFVEFERLVETTHMKKRHMDFQNARNNIENQYFIAYQNWIASGNFSFLGGLKRAFEHFGIVTGQEERISLLNRIRKEEKVDITSKSTQKKKLPKMLCIQEDTR